MSGLISFGGLASGLDTKTIIEQLTKVKQAQLVDPVTATGTTLESKRTAFDTLKTILQTFKSAAYALRDSSNAAYNTKTVSSSDTSVISTGGVSASTATDGTYKISNITHLAQQDRVIFDGVSDSNLTQFGTGNISVTYKGSTSTITIDSSNNTLEGIQTAINSAGVGVTASIINDGSSNPYRLVLTSRDTGSDASITHNLDSILSLTVDNAASTSAVNEAQNAVFEVNGVSFSSKTNTITNSIPGVTFTLLTTSSSDSLKLTVQSDTTSLASKITTFVTSYNSTRAALKTQLDVDLKTRKTGVLGREPTLTTIHSKLSDYMGSYLNGLGVSAYKSLSQIGITAKDSGELQIDSSKLTSTIQSDPTAIRYLFQGVNSQDGIAKSVYNLLDNHLGPVGALTQRQTSLNKQIDENGKLLKTRQGQLTSYTARLELKYQLMEKAINNLKAQQNAIDAYISQQNYSSNNE